MKDETLSRTESAKASSAFNHSRTDDSSGKNVVPRRSFIKALGIVGATLLPGSALLKAQAANSSRRLRKGDADLLRFALWAEIVESDLWLQYNELGGATAPNSGAPNTGNPPYLPPLQNLDGDMPQYITANTDDG